MTAPQLAPGTIVAQKYRVAAGLGYSGSAATYQAATADGRDVVVKIFDPAIRQRADIMAAIEQVYAGTNALPPEVAVPLLDAGYDGATGAPFSVVERVPLPSLLQLASHGPLPPDQVSRILSTLAGTLDQGHRRGLFHHALKPTNVFVSPSGHPHVVRVTDFGASLARTAVPTQEGYALAAPWLAPEQMQAGAPADGQADVFSIALVAFFALTGRLYWLSCQGPGDLASWQQELMSPRVPPSARAAQLGVPLNQALDAVLGCALAIDPSQRYRTPGELAQGFELVAGGHGESPATMAFPASAMGADYPPAPAPMGGYQPVPQPLGPHGHPTLQQAYGLPPPQAAPAPQAWNPQAAAEQALAGSSHAHAAHGAYVSTQTPPAPAPPPVTTPFDETAVGRPVPAAPVAPSAARNRLVPVLVGLIAVVLLGGGVSAFVLMGKRSGDAPDTAASGAASGPIAVAAPDSASAAPADSASAAPADSASAAPSGTPSATPSDTPSADPAAGGVATNLTCDPADCDEIKVDDNTIELGKPVSLTPGKHVVVATKSGYLPARETIVVKAGESADKTFKLKAATAAVGAGVPAGPKKPCGRFLARTTGCK